VLKQNKTKQNKTKQNKTKIESFFKEEYKITQSLNHSITQSNQSNQSNQSIEIDRLNQSTTKFSLP